MIRIADVEEGQISGDMTVVAVADEGKVNAGTRTLSGTIDSGLLNLKVETGGSLSLVSGVTKDNGLELTFFNDGASHKLLFERRDPKDFARLTEEARVRAASLKAEAEEQVVQQAKLRQLATDQDRINGFASLLTERGGNVADSAAKVEQAVADLNRLTPAEAATQHSQIRGAGAALEAALQGHVQRAEVFRAACAREPQLDCQGIEAALALYQSKATSLRTAIAREQAAFQGLHRLAGA